MTQLWPHQQKAYELTIDEYKKGAKAVCVVMSTGAGKSRLGAYFGVKHLEKKPEGRVLWLCHRDELLNQGFRELESWGLSVGAIAATTNLPVNPHRPVQIASTQTLLARSLTPEATLVICDELHHYASDKWEELTLTYRRRGVPIVGLTATPIRGDGRGLDGIMDSLVCPITMKQLISQGFLVPFEMHGPARPLKTGQIAQAPVDAYKEYASGRKAIVFSGNLKAGRQHMEEFLAAGIPCGMVDGKMEAGLRRKILDDYKAGTLRVLVNVGVLTEGFDDPPTSCVILARGIGSLSLYLQICGRALRLSPKTGKTNAMLLDLHGSSHVHGAPDEEHDWQLEGDAVRRKIAKRLDVRFCAVCQVLLEDDATVCPECGTVRPEPVAPTVVGTKLVKYAKKRRETIDERIAYLAKMLIEARSKDYKIGWAMNKYKVVYGDYPSDVVKAGAYAQLKSAA